jgi:hypothetical protein
MGGYITYVRLQILLIRKVPNLYFIIYLPYFRGYMISRVVSSEVFTLVGGERNRSAGVISKTFDEDCHSKKYIYDYT